MRRSLLQLTRRFERSLTTNAATAAEVPDDPDILTTQDPSFNPTEPSIEQEPQQQQDPQITNLSQNYPRLQYRSPSLGVNPAFDLALDIINKDKLETKKKLELTKAKIKRLEAMPQDPTRSLRLSDLRIYRRQLQGLLDINDPEIHWRFAHGDIDLSKPIYRHLAQRKWAERQLHLIEQRVTQMHVTPDVLPSITPSVDVRLVFPGRTHGQRKGQFEVGELLQSRDTATQPSLEIQSFADEDAKYSVAIIDPDVPEEATDSFTSYLHYLHTDISLSPTQHNVTASNGTVIHDYIPPHPQKGTPYHRYTVVVWQQPSTPVPAKQAIMKREKFDAQTYAFRNGLHAVGINFWRQVWDDNVANVMAAHPSVKYVEKNFKRIKA